MNIRTIQKLIQSEHLRGNPVMGQGRYGYAETIVPVVENVSELTSQKELINIIRKEYAGYTFTPALNELLRRKGL